MATGAQVHGVILKSDSLSFYSKENALPFPAPWPGFKMDSLVHFTKELNQEVLRVKGLKKGGYQISIDGSVIANCSQAALAAGINLSVLEQTPQYKQAVMVQEAFKKCWQIEGRLRTIRFVEYAILRSLVNKTNKDSVRIHFARVMDGFKQNPQPYSGFYQTSINKYNEDKPQEAALMQQLKVLRDSVGLLNKPVRHYFLIRRVAG